MSGIVYKRPGSPYWYVAKTRQSTKTINRKQAEEFARMVLSKVWRQTALGEYNTTWKELAEEWLEAKEDKRTLDKDRTVIKDVGGYLSKQLGTHEPVLNDITADLVSGYGRDVKARASAATANRHLNIIRAMLRRAARQSKGKFVAPPVEMYTLPKLEPKWLTYDQFVHYLSFLPDWVKPIVMLGVQTGMRWSNVAGLQWAWIDFDKRMCIVPAVSTKTRSTYCVPLSKDAVDVIEAQRGKHPKYVFVRPDGVCPIPTIRYWTDKARTDSGLEWCTFHKLRHTWASWHLQSGKTPMMALQAMGGWQSPAMLQNYAHLASSHLQAYADNVNSQSLDNQLDEV